MAQGTMLSVMWQPGWERSLGEKCICKAEALPCSLETITTFACMHTKYLQKDRQETDNTDCFQGDYNLVAQEYFSTVFPCEAFEY